MSENMGENMGVTAEELDDLAWALIEAFPEVNVNPVHAPDYWTAKATQLLPVINKIRARARSEVRAVGGYVAAEPLVTQFEEGHEITLDEALEKADEQG